MEALKREDMIKSARKLYRSGWWQSEQLDAVLEEMFPELKEFEDERIRKFIAETVFRYCGDSQEYLDVLAYLEKQKDITPIVVSNEDWDCQRAYSEGYQKGMAESNKQKPTAEEVLLKAGLKPFKDGNQWCILAGDNIQEGICGFGDTIEDALFEFLKDVCKEQKPAEWSEEDEKMLVGIIERGSAQIPPHEPALREEQMEWLMKRLRSLRPQPHWKPSKEQMKSLAQAVCIFATFEHLKDDSKVLTSLYNDLQKLL